ncbi:Rapamycin-insensitive companion of mTOR, middle domain-containing protein [Dimargaris cristalligena]|uniref:Rapamycin-insensitive companion of mTOR, middle domain-containing protein n=1 Tax=Dimargaris cristalligena TaxID=215637 RepID=A0A4Q0A073_9FUNG|nr:Rapamycin-insensitive companion of mTOR, middle domain-containing protein [Dimargaris cristalligena]|eukprot:RKP39476.1 Rapamycin-insensitive companion of mTOR, middle domain-containing protein [Dimargaris cristalligena]
MQNRDSPRLAPTSQQLPPPPPPLQPQQHGSFITPIPRTPLTPVFQPNYRRRSRSESHYPDVTQPNSRIHWTDDDRSQTGPPLPTLSAKQTTEKLLKKIEIENNIKKAAQAMLQAYNSGKKHDPLSKRQVELQVSDSIRNIANLQWQVDHIEGFSSRENQLVQSETIAPQTTILSPVFSEPVYNVKPPHVHAAFPHFCPANSEIPEAEFDVPDFVATFDQQFVNMSDQALLTSLDLLFKALLRRQQSQLLYRPEMLNSWRIRAQCYKILRNLEVNWDELNNNDYFEFLIMRSLVFEDGVQGEREQALKFLRLTIPRSQMFRREGFIRMIVAITERTEDKLRNISILTLCELIIRAGAIRALNAAANDGPWDISRSVVYTLAFTLDRPCSRQFVYLGMDLESLLVSIHETYNRAAIQEDKVKISAGIIATILNCWPGVHYLMSNNGRTFQSLTDALNTTPKSVQMALLRMLYHLFGVPKMPVDRPSSDDDVPRDQLSELEELLALPNGFPRPLHTSFNMSNLQRTILLIYFIDAGLFNNLVNLALDKDSELSRTAIYLAYYLLQAAKVPLPYNYVLKTQEIPAIFQASFDFEQGAKRHEAADVLTSLEDHGVVQTHKPSLESSVVPRAPSAYQRKMLRHVKQRLTTQYDEMEAKTLLTESQVLTETEYTSWNWGIIDELLSGPFSNAYRIEDALKNYQFFPLLSSFFCPNNGHFPKLPSLKSNRRFVQTGCMMLESLLATNEGFLWLQESEFLGNIRDHLEALTPMSNVTIADNIFSKSKLRNTLSFGYFKFINVLSKKPNGVRLLEHFSFYHLFYILAQMRSQDDVIKGLLTHMDYHNNGHPRVILSQVMTMANTKLRTFATQYLGQILATSVPDFATWGVPMLMFQMYDPTQEVQKIALGLLLQVCQDERCLESLISARPNFDHFGDSWHQLRLLLVGVPQGFLLLQTLHTPQFGRSTTTDEPVHQLAQQWMTTGNRDYAARLEINMSEFNTGDELFLTERDFEYDHSQSSRAETGRPQQRAFHAPLHLFGQLVKTPAGRSLIIENGHLDRLVAQLKNYDVDLSNAASLLEVKGALWALANMCHCENGAELVQERGVINLMVELFQTSPVCNLRGLVLNALGMVALSSVGRQALQVKGWTPMFSFNENQILYFLPPDLTQALSVEKWRDLEETNDGKDHSTTLESGAGPQPSLTDSEDTTETDILLSIGALCNNVLQASALSKAKHHHNFDPSPNQW